jgi:trimethylamine--corrinoid protein Co-methyltransferase
MMLGCAYSQIAKYYRLPSHMYIGLSDAKIIDAQCGFETGIGIALGVLAGINVISGPGMLNFENCQSLEKLVIDNEICGIALRLSKGITFEDETLATNLIEKVGPGGTYLTERHTLEWVRKEQFIPSEIIDRKEWKAWKASGSKDIVKRAHEIVEKTLKMHKLELLPQDIQRDLEKVMEDIMKRNIKISS